MNFVISTAPRSFISSANALAQSSGVIDQIATGMPNMGHYCSIPDEMEPLVYLKFDAELTDNPRSTMPLRPTGNKMSTGNGQMERAGTDFSAQMERLQSLADGLDKTRPVRVGSGRPEVIGFMNRLCAMTNLTPGEIVKGLGNSDTGSELKRLCRLKGKIGFAILDHVAKSAMNGNGRGLTRRISSIPTGRRGEDPSRDTRELAEDIFRSALIYLALDDMWGYGEVDARLNDARRLFLRGGLVGSAALCADLSAKAWDLSSSSSAPDRPEVNPRSRSAAWLMMKTLDSDLNRNDFGIRYLYGAYHARRAREWKAMEGIFKASISFFSGPDQKRDRARAHIRRVWAFVRRPDLKPKDWSGLSGDLRLASDLFSDSWSNKDSEMAIELGRLSKEANKIARGKR